MYPDPQTHVSRGCWDAWVAKALQGTCPKCGRQRVVRRRNDPDFRPATWCCDRCWNDTVRRNVAATYHADADAERLAWCRMAASFERSRIRKLLVQLGVSDDVLAALDDLDPLL